MNKHTPGPYFDGLKSEIRDGACICAPVPFKPGSDMVIARMNYHLDNWRANQRLFLAAPDMLDALITDYLVFKNYENIHNAKGNVEKAFSNKAQADRIRGIIESATGESIDGQSEEVRG